MIANQLWETLESNDFNHRPKHAILKTVAAYKFWDFQAILSSDF